jgi:DNA-binding NtrC family response regulator
MAENGNGRSHPKETSPVTDALFARAHARAAQNVGKAALPLDDWVDLVTASRIADALRDCRGNRSAAARALGIGRRTLYTKIQKLGLHAQWEIVGDPE